MVANNHRCRQKAPNWRKTKPCCHIEVAQNFSLSLESFYFCELKAHDKFQNPTLRSYGVLATAVRRKQEEKTRKLSARADGGPRFWVCTCKTLCSVPHRHTRTFFATHVCRINFKDLPQVLKTCISPFPIFFSLIGILLFL